MTSLQGWLTKPRATVRLDTSVNWSAWAKLLRRPFQRAKDAPRPRIQVLDRVSLGGKRSLVLVAIEQQRLLIGVGESTAPSLINIEMPKPAQQRMATRQSRIGAYVPRRYR